jgi:hypothetical protein
MASAVEWIIWREQIGYQLVPALTSTTFCTKFESSVKINSLPSPPSSVINNQQFVASMSNGDVKIVNCGALSADGGDDESAANGNNNGGGRQPSKMVTMATYPRVHRFLKSVMEISKSFPRSRQAASTAVCVLESEIFSGSDTGQIVRIQPASRTANPVRPFVEDLMGMHTVSSCPKYFILHQRRDRPLPVRPIPDGQRTQHWPNSLVGCSYALAESPIRLILKSCSSNPQTFPQVSNRLTLGPSPN